MKAADIFVHRDQDEQVKVDNVVEVVVQAAEEDEEEEAREVVVPEVIKPIQNGCPPPIIVTQQQSVPSLQFDLVEDLVGSSDEEDMKQDHESGLPDSVIYFSVFNVDDFKYETYYG